MPRKQWYLRYPKDTSLPLKYYYVWVELPKHEGGRRRIPVRSKDITELKIKLEQKQQDLRERGDLYTNDMTVQQWFRYWLEIVRKERRPKTVDGYKSVTNQWIIPTIGTVKLEKLTANHLRQVERAMLAAGKSSTYAKNAHAVMSRALEIALREGRVGRNVAKLMDAPRKARNDQQAFEVDEVVKVLGHISEDKVFGARWATALLTGARRGEVIGLERNRVGDDLDLSWQLQRIIWAHGCGDPVGKTDKGRDIYPCEQKTGHSCPKRRLHIPSDYEYRHIDGGLYWTRPKSSAGWRIIPLVEPLRSILERHIAGTPNNPWGLVFTWTNQDGEQRPIDPDADTRLWRRVLADTGIDKDVPLHGLRHTAVDLLYEAGVSEDLIPLIVGHSDRAMSRSYKTRSKAQQARIRKALEQVSTLLSSPTGARSGTSAAIESTPRAQ
ncbi:tyrosine-type recombinase/integrase [Leifsonia sp. F6_8S_P_1B]|uniref:Tyrosine-type recombinase/integrase n=1 Tax=Leifsonia williamsii TaxID=3035919 RepID=A0ABT8KJE3_9MICO|nr:tyrosine-type recombinase/integrase [Leifsonia williamsii]MDN4616454.1 tyrosine-type recombinase/integrase [Leifsonia williamsii]